MRLRKGIDRLIEQQTGKYQFHELYDEAANQRPPVLYHATYIGPVEASSAGHRGRSLFTTKEVKTGDLLLCEKAAGFEFVNRSDPYPQLSVLVNAEQNTAIMGA